MIEGLESSRHIYIYIYIIFIGIFQAIFQVSLK